MALCTRRTSNEFYGPRIASFKALFHLMAKGKMTGLIISHFALNMKKINQRKNVNGRKVRRELNQARDCGIHRNKTHPVNNMLTLTQTDHTTTSLSEISKQNYTLYFWMVSFASSPRKKQIFSPEVKRRATAPGSTCSCNL